MGLLRPAFTFNIDKVCIYTILQAPLRLFEFVIGRFEKLGWLAWLIWNYGSYGLIFLWFDNTNQVMQNLIPKCIQCSIVFEKQSYLSEKLSEKFYAPTTIV